MFKQVGVVRYGVLALMLLGLAWGLSQLALEVAAAPRWQVSPTPAPVVLPSLTQTAGAALTATPTRTPTPVGPALAEAREGPTNVRAGPDIEAERLGVIYPGEFYPVLGRAAGTLWLKIQYPESPSGTAWVFEQVVFLTGEVDAIPELSISSEPTIDVSGVVGTRAVEELAQTPGALATATAEALFSGAGGTGGTPIPTTTRGPLPTFTYPPDLGTQATAFVPPPNPAVVPDGSMPPIIPIIALAALGGLGLLVGILRRMG